MDFSSAADELYGVPPADFVATRKRLARAARDAGDRSLAGRIERLRRPTLSAWAVNLLARSAAGDLDDLLDVGAEIRAAWASGRGLGGLEQRRARLVGALVRAAADLAAEAGGPLREQAVREVEDTLMAATVDPGIAEEVRQGRLSQPRSHTGFVPVGFPPAPEDGAERAEPTAPKGKHTAKAERAGRAERAGKGGKAAEVRAEPSGDSGGEGEQTRPEREKPTVTRTSAARERRAKAAARRAEAAERRLAAREERVWEARRQAEEASAEVGRLRHALERAVAARDAAVRRAERAEQGRSRARDEAEEARRAAREAREAADRDARHG